MLRGAHVGMPHAVLDIGELVIGLFQLVSDGSAQGMGGGAFGHACGTDGDGDDPAGHRWGGGDTS
jgi:hypothetical protein